MSFPKPAYCLVQWGNSSGHPQRDSSDSGTNALVWDSGDSLSLSLSPLFPLSLCPAPSHYTPEQMLCQSFGSSRCKRFRVIVTPRSTDTFHIVLHLSLELMGNHSIKTSTAEYIKPQYEFKKMKTARWRLSEASLYEMKFCFISTDFLGEMRWLSG